MSAQRQLLTPREASRNARTYPAIKNWILSGKLKTVRTPGGHHSSLQPVSSPSFKRMKRVRKWSCERATGASADVIQLAGKVVSIRVEELLAETTS